MTNYVCKNECNIEVSKTYVCVYCSCRSHLVLSQSFGSCCLSVVPASSREDDGENTLKYPV